jgi:hypothetical protein
MGDKGEDTDEGHFKSDTNHSKFFKGAIVLYKILDVEAVPVDKTMPGGPADKKDQSIKTFAFNSAPEILQSHVVIAGGGMGGLAAALALGPDLRVILTEETSWLGGQLSSQGVSALDENKYVETTGACANYLELRKAIRESYRKSGNLNPKALAEPIVNPGSCWVTRLAFEPEVAVTALKEMLAPQLSSGNLTILKRAKIVAIHLAGDEDKQLESAEAAKIDALLAVNLDSGRFIEIQCAIAIDATELGDLMPLAKIPYHSGSDSSWVTGEPHAPETANPDNVQDFTYPFIVTYHPGENHTIDKPADYDTFAAAGKFSFDGYKMFEETDYVTPEGKKKHFLPFWTYRRLIDKDLFKEGVYKSDVAMINWDSNDLRGKNIIDKSPELQRDYLSLAKRVSLGFLYWLQTTAPRDDGGQGYPELKLNYDLLGTEDGLSKYPYIREARRLAATTTIIEQDIVGADNPLARAKFLTDSCGIGLYPVDIHGYQEVPGAGQETKPFQVPVSAMVTDYCANYIAACKNIGVTHITNGAYRLHPIEWAIGTAAGALAKLSLLAFEAPLTFASAPDYVLDLQTELAHLGAPIFWFDDLPPSHEAFAAAQVLTTIGLWPFDQNTLSFDPDSTISQKDIDAVVQRANELFGELTNWTKEVNDIQKQTPNASRAQFAQKFFTALRAAVQPGATTVV